MRMFSTFANASDTDFEQALCEQPVYRMQSAYEGVQGSLTVDVSHVRQRIDGFGASITQATSYLWHHHVADPHQMLTDLFDVNDGIGLPMLRQPVGPSDHVVRPYSFLRTLPDPNLRSLTFDAEEAHIIPMVAAAQRMRAESIARSSCTHEQPMNIIVSPWSAPWWMKTNFSIYGKRRFTRLTGYLRKSCYRTYAHYLAHFMQVYERHGLHVFGVTPTNEPDYPQSRWPSMAMTPDQQAHFIADDLAPVLHEHGLDRVNIMCWDHNYSTDRYPDGAFVRDVYAHQRAFEALAGSAWHYYGGASRTMSKIHEQWPNKGIWITEASGGDWGPRNFDEALLSMSGRVIAMMNNWAQSVILWNIALDTRGGPDYFYLRNEFSHSKNRGLLTVDRRTGQYIKNADYYVLGHFSKYVPVGSHCIGSVVRGVKDVHHVAFLTPDNHVVSVLANQQKNPVQLHINLNDSYVQLPARSLNTIVCDDFAHSVSVHSRLG